MTAKTLHVPPWPVPCDGCIEELSRQAIKRTDLGAVTVYCPHNFCLVTAVLGEHGGERAITSWSANGPMTDEQAAEEIGRMAQVGPMENLGAKAH